MPKVVSRPASTAPGKLVQTISIEGPQTKAAKPRTGDRGDFWEKMYALTPEEWASHYVYLWRTRPTVETRGEGTYVARLSAPFDVADIAERFGGQEFRAVLRNRKTGAFLAETRFANELPPKLDPSREVAPAAPAPSAGAAPELVQLLREELARRADGGTDEMRDTFFKLLLASAPKQPNTTEMIQAMVAMKRELGGDSGGMNELLKPLLGALVQKLLAPGAEAGDPLGQFEKLLAIAERLGIKIGSIGARRSTAEVIADAVPVAIEKAGMLLREYANAAAVVRANRISGFPPVPSAPPRLPARLPLPAAAPPAPAPAGAMATEPLGPPPAAASPAVPAAAGFQPVTTFQELKNRVAQMIRDGFDGPEVLDFVTGVFPKFGEDIGASNEAQIRALFAADDVLRAVMTDPNFEPFMESLMAYIGANAAEKPN
jgi:hypothetical protein